MSTRIRSEDDIADEAPRLSDEELENVDVDVDVDGAFANADLTSPDADASDLRAVTEADDAMEHSRSALEAAVQTARLRGRSWARIGGLLGVTRQAAQQRFGHVEPRRAQAQEPWTTEPNSRPAPEVCSRAREPGGATARPAHGEP